MKENIEYSRIVYASKYIFLNNNNKLTDMHQSCQGSRE
jgi:hypothetical protein